MLSCILGNAKELFGAFQNGRKDLKSTGTCLKQKDVPLKQHRYNYKSTYERGIQGATDRYSEMSTLMNKFFFFFGGGGRWFLLLQANLLTFGEGSFKAIVIKDTDWGLPIPGASGTNAGQ